MNIVFRAKEDAQAEIIFYPVLQDDKAINALLKKLDYENEASIFTRLKREDFKAKSGQFFVIHDEEQSVVLIGRGEEKKFDLESWRVLAGQMANYLKKQQVKSAGLELDYWLNNKKDVKDLAKALAEGFYLANYKFDKFINKKDKISSFDLENLFIYTDKKSKNIFQKAWQEGVLFAQATALARDLVNEPASTMNPQFLADTAIRIAKENKNISVKVLEEAEVKKMGMGAYLGIAKGSVEKPKFIHLIYKPNAKAKDKVALVGKGITFDSGGLNIKPFEGMINMKIDMGGAATVLGVFEVIAKLNPKVEVHGVIAACENMPSGNAVRPGDVLHSMSGQTIEIANTDAEGRVTLADALHYIQQKGVKKIVDLATLTGAVVIGLGPNYAALFASDDKMSKQILDSAKKEGEPLWPLPLAKEYKDFNESKIADIRNIPNTRGGGTITAALFLKHFVADDVAWAHIDIAGPVYAEKDFNSYTPAGGVGFGVRTLLDWLSKM